MWRRVAPRNRRSSITLVWRCRAPMARAFGFEREISPEGGSVAKISAGAAVAAAAVKSCSRTSRRSPRPPTLVQPSGCYLSTVAGIIRGLADALIYQLEGLCMRACMPSKVLDGERRAVCARQSTVRRAACRWTGSCAAAACPAAVFASRRPLPSSSSRQGAIMSARTRDRMRDRLTQPHTHSRRVAYLPALTVPVDHMRVAAHQ